MFMEHTDCMVFTKEDSELLEQYFDAVGQPPKGISVILRGLSGRAWANGIVFWFPGVDLDTALNCGFTAAFIDMLDPDDLGNAVFCKDSAAYEKVVNNPSYAGRIFQVYKNGDWIYYG